MEIWFWQKGKKKNRIMFKQYNMLIYDFTSETYSREYAKK